MVCTCVCLSGSSLTQEQGHADSLKLFLRALLWPITLPPCRNWSCELSSECDSRDGGSTRTEQSEGYSVGLGKGRPTPTCPGIINGVPSGCVCMCEQGCTKAWACFLRVSKESFAVNLARNARCVSDQVRVSTS